MNALTIFRIAALADLNACDPRLPGSPAEEIVAATNALNPDAVVLLLGMWNHIYGNAIQAPLRLPES